MPSETPWISRITLIPRGCFAQSFLIALVVFLVVYSVIQMNLLPQATEKLGVADLYNDESVKRQLEYAVMVDAGSSGSRIYVYAWPPHSGDPRQLLQIRLLTDQLGKPVVKKILPGLSSFADKPSEASDYFLPLLQFAADHIPASKHSQTPLYILATAGMRLLPQKTQEKILNDIRFDIPRNFSFIFPSNHVEVITGRQEGIYSWIAINYIMGRFDHSFAGPMVAVDMEPGSEKNSTVWRKRTIGMLEMGGASVQVAFEVTNGTHLSGIKDKTRKEHIAEVNLGCLPHDSDHEYHLYVATYLGLGANIARLNFQKQIVMEAKQDLNKRNSSRQVSDMMLLNPCMCRDQLETVKLSFPSSSNISSDLYTFKGSGDLASCKKHQVKLLNVTVNCTESPCTVNDTYQPHIDYKEMEFYGFSEFWYSMEDILRLGGLYDYSKMEKATKAYCATKWSLLENRFRHKLYSNIDYDRLETECFKAAWLTTVLHEGLKFPKNYRKLHSANMIGGQEVQWTLGALLHRTRYFPLRAIERQAHSSQKPLRSKITQIMNNSYMFIGCMAVVTGSILIYLCHLRHMLRCPLSRASHIIKSKDSFEDDELKEELLSVSVDKLDTAEYYR